MQEQESRILRHYQKVQECLTDLLDPSFGKGSQSFTFILLNQIYTNAERLFELVEQSPTLSGTRQAILAKLAHHIENTKERGLGQDFREFVKGEFSTSLAFIRDLFDAEFKLAS